MTPDQIIGLAILAFSFGYLFGQLPRLREGERRSSRDRYLAGHNRNLPLAKSSRKPW